MKRHMGIALTFVGIALASAALSVKAASRTPQVTGRQGDDAELKDLLSGKGSSAKRDELSEARQNASVSSSNYEQDCKDLARLLAADPRQIQIQRLEKLMPLPVGDLTSDQARLSPRWYSIRVGVTVDDSEFRKKTLPELNALLMRICQKRTVAYECAIESRKNVGSIVSRRGQVSICEGKSPSSGLGLFSDDTSRSALITRESWSIPLPQVRAQEYAQYEDRAKRFTLPVVIYSTAGSRKVRMTVYDLPYAYADALNSALTQTSSSLGIAKIEMMDTDQQVILEMTSAFAMAPFLRDYPNVISGRQRIIVVAGSFLSMNDSAISPYGNGLELVPSCEMTLSFPVTEQFLASVKSVKTTSAPPGQPVVMEAAWMDGMVPAGAVGRMLASASIPSRYEMPEQLKALSIKSPPTMRTASVDKVQTKTPPPIQASASSVAAQQAVAPHPPAIPPASPATRATGREFEDFGWFRKALCIVPSSFVAFLAAVLGWVIFPWTLAPIKFLLRSPMEIWVDRLIGAVVAAVFAFMFTFGAMVEVLSK